MQIGDNIRRRRVELNMSQQQLADALGYKTRSSIAKIENGTTDVPQSRLISFANILNTSLEYLLTGDPTKHPATQTQATVETPNKLAQVSPENTPSCIAIILAGGHSRKNRRNTPLQFVSLNGKPIILYTMEAYQNHPAIDKIYVVCLEGWESIIPAYAKQYNITKLVDIIPAGTNGILSVKNAVEWIGNTCTDSDIIILQEATRPLITDEIISNTIRCCNLHGTAITCEPFEEHAPFYYGDNGIQYIDSTKLINAQSPEAYTYKTLKNAFLEAKKIGHKLDEYLCVRFLYNLGKKLTFCEGSHYNLRIIREEDIALFDAILHLSEKSWFSL